MVIIIHLAIQQIRTILYFIISLTHYTNVIQMLYSTGAHITKIVQIDESDDDEYFSTEEDSAGI